MHWIMFLQGVAFGLSIASIMMIIVYYLRNKL